ncbi:MAG: hypothetical protein KBT03_09950 [Bacteroidales bacterium]|nr:hypothetical protein [Candidatus Scybalousia scybalohippi]
MMDKRLENIAMYATRVAGHRISFSTQREEPERENRYDLQEGEEREEYGQEFRLRDSQSGEELNLDGVVIIDSSRTKNIVSTQINGQSATIKEWINNGDYILTLTIAAITEGDEFPEDRLKEIVKMCDKNRTLEVENKYLNEILGITRIVVTSNRTAPETWKSNQKVVVECMSDESYIIEEELLK